jgi:simple sugar transport system ATP-binding protein
VTEQHADKPSSENKQTGRAIPWERSADKRAEDELSLVTVRDVSKTFGSTRALRNVSLKVEPGQSHGLVGRNGAGKSTLVSILTGLTGPDTGEVRFQNSPAPSLADRKSWRRLVACVYQRSTIVPSLSVAENLFLSRLSVKAGFINWPTLRGRAQDLLADWQLDIPVTTIAEKLTVEQRQLVEIARALSAGAKLIILDEPTAELDNRGISRLFGHMKRLHERGITFVYISHHLQELYEVCSTVTVLRDGAATMTAHVSQVSEDQLVSAMVGSEIVGAGVPSAALKRSSRPNVLRVEHATLTDVFMDINLSVSKSEIVGLAGLAGSGKASFGDALAGLVALDSGSISIEDRPVTIKNPLHAIKCGIGYVPEDRHARGLVPHLSVAENLTLSVMGQMGHLGYISQRKREAMATKMIKSAQIVAASPSQSVSGLSGGNQQKVVIGRALMSDPKVLVLLHPTTGVDIASKQAIAAILVKATSDGVGILIISDEYDELINCDRIMIMFRGSITKEFGPDHNERDVVAAMEGI